jgi:hypothetical protein
LAISFSAVGKLRALVFSAIGEVATILWLLIKGVSNVDILPFGKINYRTISAS